jgi:hypothetical protein
MAATCLKYLAGIVKNILRIQVIQPANYTPTFKTVLSTWHLREALKGTTG